MHEPRWADHQELNVLDKGWFFSFHLVPVELTDPREHKNDNGHQPNWRDVNIHNPLDQKKANKKNKHHANAQGYRQGDVVQERNRH